MRKTILLLCSIFSFLILSGQSLLKDVAPGNNYSIPLFLGEANQKLFFAKGYNANESYRAAGIWASNGTAAGTIELLSIGGTFQRYYDPVLFPAKQGFPIFNNRLIFPVNGSNTNWQLYSSDGTKLGTQKFMDFADSVFLLSFGQPDAGIVNGSFFFTTTNYNGNVYVWKSDGTRNGTKIIMNHFSYLFWGVYLGMPNKFTVFNNAAYFISLSDTNTLTFWRTDGTVNGIQALASFPRPQFVTGYIVQVFKNKLYFGILDSSSKTQVWTSDGTAVGTKPLQDIPGGPFLNHFDILTEVGSKAFFLSDDAQYGYELWMTDGTVTGTKLVKDIFPGVGHGCTAIVGKTSNRIFLLARDTTSTIFNLWSSDGTSEGTIQLPKTFVPTKHGFERYPYIYLSSITVNDKLFFQNFTDKLEKESELWITDGTQTGTKPVIDNDSLLVTPSLYFPTPFALYKNKIYFSAFTSQTGIEPHYIDSCLCTPDNSQTISGKLFPNPTSGKVIIDIEWNELNVYKEANLLVFDAIGRKVLSQIFPLNETCGQLSFETSRLSQGVYFATVFIGDKKFAKRFVVVR